MDQPEPSQLTAGWSVLEDIIPEDRLAAIREEVETSVGAHGIQPFVGIVFLHGLINHVQSFASFLADSRLNSLVQTMLGEFFRVSFCSGIVTIPGSPRGPWHADWPFNQQNAARIVAPYPDVVMHITTLWMLSEFTEENGTFLVPGSHRYPNNPTGGFGVDLFAKHPAEVIVTGRAGSVLVFDSRLWHAPAPNRSDHSRVAVSIRYAPWWLDLAVLKPGTEERRRMVDEVGGSENLIPPIRRRVFEDLPSEVRHLFRHWVKKEEE